MKDSFNRKIDYMRISITDRCNLRCRYCMPEGVELCSHDDIISFDEIVRVCRQAVKLGIVNFKITGGEPLVRRGCATLIKKIYEIKGVEQVTLTTNAVLLENQLMELVEAGVKSINVSLDTLDRQKYEQITGSDKLLQVLSAIDKSIKLGIKVKINAVLHSDDFEKDLFDLIDFGKNKKIDVRFIEMMPIGEGANSKLISNELVYDMVLDKFKNLKQDDEKRGNGPAKYYNILDIQTRIGFISAIHGKFCDSCNRIRMTSKGEIKSCLCFEQALDVREAAREKDEEKILEVLKNSILNKPEKHVFEDDENITENRKMIQIGG